MTGPKTSEFSDPTPTLPVQPEPLIRGREILLTDCPGGAKAKIRKARRAGLEAAATYALGFDPGALGTKFTLKHSIVVRISDPATAEILAVAYWIRGVPRELEASPRYARAEWILRVIAAYPKWSADGVIFRDTLGVHSMADLDVWLADREAE